MGTIAMFALHIASIRCPPKSNHTRRAAHAGADHARGSKNRLFYQKYRVKNYERPFK